MRLIPFAATLAALVATGSVVARADQPTTLDELLAAAPSPGVEVLLLPHATDPRVPERWRAALTAPDVGRRAAAARMIGIANVRSALGSLRAALLAEQDRVVLAEMLRAMAIIGSEQADSVIYARLEEPTGLPVDAIAAVLTSLRPASVVTHILDGGTLSTRQEVVSNIYGRLLAATPGEAERLERELATADRPVARRSVLHVAHSTGRSVPAALVVAVLGADASSAGEALSYIGDIHGTPEKARADAELVAAVAQRRGAPAPPDPLHRVVLMLVDRWLGEGASTSMVQALGQIDPQEFQGLALGDHHLAVLTRDERLALAARLGFTTERRNQLVAARFERPASPRAWDTGAKAPAHLLTDLPGVIVADLKALTACRSTFEESLPAILTYRPDGRPSAVTVGDVKLSPACDRLRTALVLATYGPPPVPGAQASRVLVRLDDAWVQCRVGADAHARSARERTGRITNFTPPKKTRDRKPIYPDEALRRNIEGVVVLEGRIIESGCLGDVRVVRSIPLLDLASIAAVSEWRYTPAHADGGPVPVTMVLTVNFTRR